MNPSNQSPAIIKCKKCKKSTSDKKPGAKCDCCDVVLCSDCAGLSATEGRVLDLKSNRSLLFLCPDCRGNLRQLPMLVKLVSELRDELKCLKKRQESTEMERTIAEWQERKTRAKNIIIFDTEESGSSSAEDRMAHDKRECQKLIAQLAPEVPTGNIKVFRLGAPSANLTKPRPIKVILKSKTEALQILKNKAKHSKPSAIKGDSTPMQREHLLRLREELAERTGNGEADLTIKYIGGCPKIITIQKN